jgi:hypothetical protein
VRQTHERNLAAAPLPTLWPAAISGVLASLGSWGGMLLAASGGTCHTSLELAASLQPQGGFPLGNAKALQRCPHLFLAVLAALGFGFFGGLTLIALNFGLQLAPPSPCACSCGWPPQQLS